MNVASLCRREVVTIPASATVRQAAAVMRSEHVGALAVTDPYESGHVIGIVTDRDLVIDLLAEGRPVDQAIGSLCRADLVSVPANASVHDAVLAMQRNSVRRLLAVDEDNAVVGVLSADDVCQAIAAELDALAASLRGNVIAEGARERARARTQGEPPQPLYATRHEP